MKNLPLKLRLLHLLCVLLLLTTISSCDREWPDDLCDCHHGSNDIGGWEDANDTTIVHKNDTVGGFAISVDDWGNIITNDIRL